LEIWTILGILLLSGRESRAESTSHLFSRYTFVGVTASNAYANEDIGMNAIEEAVKELVNDLLQTLQAEDSRGVAILRLLKDKGIVSDDELAPYLEQAANASSVKERAARVRFEHLIASAIKGVRELAQQTAAKVVEEGPAQRKEGEASKEASKQSSEKDQHAEVSQTQSEQRASSAQSASDEREPEKSESSATNRDKAA
jgi:uncharacterized protein YdiU (UPF0061 family)